MSDLISREAFKEALEDYGFNQETMIPVISLMKVLEIVDNQPTAYDVDKVVEQLDSNCWKDIDNIDLPGIDLEKAIELVKAGGKE